MPCNRCHAHQSLENLTPLRTTQHERSREQHTYLYVREQAVGQQNWAVVMAVDNLCMRRRRRQDAWQNYAVISATLAGDCEGGLMGTKCWVWQKAMRDHSRRCDGILAFAHVVSVCKRGLSVNWFCKPCTSVQPDVCHRRNESEMESRYWDVTGLRRRNSCRRSNHAALPKPTNRQHNHEDQDAK